MDKKLTLSLNSTVIDRAKEYAKNRDISLSRMIENYLSSLTAKDKDEESYSPLVMRMLGVVSLPDDLAVDSDYTDYLMEKYK